MKYRVFLFARKQEEIISVRNKHVGWIFELFTCSLKNKLFFENLRIGKYSKCPFDRKQTKIYLFSRLFHARR